MFSERQHQNTTMRNKKIGIVFHSSLLRVNLYMLTYLKCSVFRAVNVFFIIFTCYKIHLSSLYLKKNNCKDFLPQRTSIHSMFTTKAILTINCYVLTIHLHRCACTGTKFQVSKICVNNIHGCEGKKYRMYVRGEGKQTETQREDKAFTDECLPVVVANECPQMFAKQMITCFEGKLSTFHLEYKHL